MEEEILLDAREELKRLEHIIYVSLKYTRTVDVIINAMQRMVDTYDLIIEAFLEKAKEEGLTGLLPKSPGLRVKEVLKLYPDDAEIKKYLTFYSFLKFVLNSPHKKEREYRRHVALFVEYDNYSARFNIDNLVNCEKFIHRFFRYAVFKILGKKDEEEA